MKICCTCKTAKPLDSFGKDRSRHDGLSSQCKPCKLIKNKRYALRLQRNRPDAHRARNQSYWLRHQGTPHGISMNWIKSVRSKSPDSDITVEWLKSKLALGKCEATGIVLDFLKKTQINTKSRRSPFAPSLDRLDCRRGYYRDNVRVVCLSFNTARQDFSDADVLTWARSFVELQAASPPGLPT